MHIIKKYANRKLYHTNRKQYITLDGIAKLVQDDEAVQILDNETGEDITSSILAQVVLQSRGRSIPQLPATFLTGMIQLGGDTIANLRQTLFTSLGGSDLIEAEIGRRLDTLIERNEITPEESVRWRQLLLHHEFAESSRAQIENREVTVPSRNDVVRLHAQVDALAEIVDQLLKKK
ncbi:PHA accumulation regulator DNA-binding protein [Oscillochloris trichoides DG-6]|uniref:PHA accumulation regulator DNA-binding protein n=1 Tax=Oscillochloris trichoides DG-6 TaxID=765420 RepID=E1IFK5_9CHLR|nr:polyhydroxyalkanoate synthesis regulator DNA-binding domain-containing protein [Oscillochloris trichoides]EFO80021.1 PHA accumulation regulator DNA-binding protein [Oscillochloris trichoides DG-6]